ncbi:hypothetical protein CHLRE_13g565750v5 [Chlamydomonas reinhardtii]|uniref:Tr-type G domain-containing protein n=1 Tax=Chlamydomonas reinhardtii TaxID=3055 RepID=A0A2K3CZ89_CHLRE|nr:uncharacterized protein CHLRE_13g565750v5 [Chlamydomonas reinhardtii]PNW73614.1 hypothetical protein CHLRE_13g565750v5 [Chlamydomonas reinhardtii]
MTKGKRGAFYDDDDLDDGYDDDYDDDYYEEEPAPAPKKAELAKPQAGGKQPAQTAPKAAPSAAPARAAGASKLAQSLCDPPPPGPGGKAQRGAKPDPAVKSLHQPTYPVAPAATSSSPFQFDTPSPDDAVKAAQERKPGAVAPPAAAAAPTAPSLPQNKNFLRPSPMLQQQKQQQGGPANGEGADEAARGVAALGLTSAASGGSEGGTTPGGGTRQHHPHLGHPEAPNALSHPGGLHGLHTRRPVTEYVMEADLARDVAAATASESSSTSTSGSSSGSSKPPLHLVVLGHVDAGKSSLMGRLLHDLGLVSAKEAHKFQRDAAAAGKGSFAWAWVLDERPEERERGVTMDVAMTRFATNRFAVTLLDAPGHRDFVPNMIAGAAQADAALLLVDGSPGGFEAGFSEGSGGLHGAPGGQTREHAALARSLGIEQMAVVVSKLDTCGYDQSRFESIRAALLPYLKSVGFKESGLQWLPAAGPLGENLVGPPQDPALKAWWGPGRPCVTDAIDAFAPRERAVSRPLRLPVSDVFKSKTGAVVLGGKLEGGAMRPGSRVVLVPGPAQPFAVRSLEVGGGAANLARAGDSCEVALVAHGGGGGGGGAIDPSLVAPGAVLCHADFPAVLVTKFQLRLVVLDVPVPLLRGQAVTLHAHVAREEGHLSALVALLDPRTGEEVKARPRCLTRGQSALVEVTSSRGLVLEEYAHYRALGRVALREGGRTLAVGVVTQLLE